MSFLLKGAPTLDPPLESWLSLAYVAFFSTLGGFGAWGFLLRRYNASTVGPYALLVPVFGLSSAALVAGEPLSWPTLLAAALIIAGVLYAGSRPRSSPQDIPQALTRRPA